jgi:hypothetical protein
MKVTMMRMLEALPIIVCIPKLLMPLLLLHPTLPLLKARVLLVVLNKTEATRIPTSAIQLLTARNKYFGAASSPFGEIQHDDAVSSVSPINKVFKVFNFGNAEEDTNISLSDEYDSTFHHHHEDNRELINLVESNIYHFVNPKVLTNNGERYTI